MNIIDKRPKQPLIDIEVGDILDVGYGLRMIVKDEGQYSAMDLDGNIQISWYKSIQEVVNFYAEDDSEVDVIKKADMDLILKKSMESKGE